MQKDYDETQDYIKGFTKTVIKTVAGQVLCNTKKQYAILIMTTIGHSELLIVLLLRNKQYFFYQFKFLNKLVLYSYDKESDYVSFFL
jgi:hypothetical protein